MSGQKFSYIAGEIESLTSQLPYGEKSEQELAVLVAAGDERAFKQLYFLLLPRLRDAGMKLLKSESAVAEVIQEALIRVWVHRAKLADVRSVSGWVYRIFSNECFRYLKKYGLASLPLEAVEDAQGEHGPEQYSSMQETRRIIHGAVKSLSPRQREIYQLSRERGLKVSEIAAELGLASKYVKKTLSTALHAIRRQLVKAGKTYFFF